MTTPSPRVDSAVETPESAPTMPPRKSVWAIIEDGILTVLAAIGVICIIATVAALALNINLIMFKTGSMSPTIPTGSLAVVREIPASEVKVGDVTTVSRGEGQLPVTHRVIAATPAANGNYEIEMKGDANAGPDPSPYTVSTVKKVLWHAPGLAYVVSRAGTPKYMIGITIAASLLVVWAFWPRRKH